LASSFDYYNNRQYHESLDNLIPSDVYFDRGPAILKQREIIKRKIIEHSTQPAPAGNRSLYLQTK
jgi:putative transposase